MKSIDDVFNDDVIHADRETYEIAVALGKRIGQAYFASLDEPEKKALRDSDYDPFYSDDIKSVLRAHKYLKSLFIGAK